jgi:hypothetical protein
MSAARGEAADLPRSRKRRVYRNGPRRGIDKRQAMAGPNEVEETELHRVRKKDRPNALTSARLRLGGRCCYDDLMRQLPMPAATSNVQGAARESIGITQRATLVLVPIHVGCDDHRHPRCRLYVSK